MALFSGIAALAPLSPKSPVQACTQPGLWDVAAGFDRVANGLLPPNYPQLPRSTHIRTVPPSVLKAVGWVESGWRQFAPQGRPFVSPDFGYGIMQVTSGMDGAFGRLHGSISPSTQSQIASDYQYNIAYGARLLALKWAAVPRIGGGDPAAVENWYYALWAYNGWGWVNNPNNPRFARRGTPASDPSSYPYQERVLYLVAHPPRDSSGDPLWQPVPVTLPSRRLIGSNPQAYIPRNVHLQIPPASSAIYQPPTLATAKPGILQRVAVKVANTGIQPWLSAGTSAISLSYHVFAPSGDPWKPFSPFTPGVLAYGQAPTAIPHDVLPGDAVTVTVPVLAPQKAGKYRIVWDIQVGEGLWFSQEGVLPRAQILRVSSTVSTPVLASPTPTSTANAAERLIFITDTSIRDGSVVAPGQSFQKGWLVFNGGRTAWKKNWTLRRISGRWFGAATIQVPVTSACHSVNVVASLKAPVHVGRYTTSWRMRDPSGQAFGDKLTLNITVSRGVVRPTATPVEPASPTPTINIRPTSTSTPVG